MTKDLTAPLVACCLCLTALGGSSGHALAPAPVMVSPADPNVRYFGRWDRSDAGEYAGRWAGPYLRAGFTGPRLAVRLGEGEPSSFYASIDGGPAVEFSEKRGTVDLTPAGGLEEGRKTHQLFLVARVGKALRFRGLELAPGGRSVPPEVAPRSVLFVGDSITVGASAANPTLDSWAPRAAVAAGCEHARVAQGGIGLVDGYDAPLGRRGMEKQFFRRDAFGTPQGDAPYDGFARESPRPDVVVVNLGTNDANRNEKDPAPLDVFRDRYAVFLGELRKRYPGAVLLALEPFNRSAAKGAAVREAVTKHAAAAGDTKAFCVSTDGWVDPNPAGGDVAPDWSHPTDRGHRKLGERMAEVLRRHLPGPRRQQ